MAKKQLFGVFAPILGEKKDFPTILLDKTVQVDNRDIVRKYGEVHRRQMREPDMLDSGSAKSQTPDANPILHYHTFVKRSTGMQYELAFTKAHIYCWNSSTKVWDLKFTCQSDCTEWDTITYNDMVFATNNVDMVLKWDTTGYFMPLQNTTPTNITAVAGGATINRTDIAFVDGGAGEDTITTVAGDFVAAGFVAGNSIKITGSTSNDGTYTIVSVVALTINVGTGLLTAEAAGADITIENGNPCQVTAAGHNLTTGDRVFIKNCGGMVEINNLQFVVTVIDVNKFTLDGINSSTYTTYTSGGTVVEFEGIEFSRSYSNETNVDETSADGQKVLKVAVTTGYASGDKIVIGMGTEREEEGVIDSVQAGISLTLIDNLIYEHTVDAETTVDADSVDGQKVLNVTATTGFSVKEYVYINLGGDRAEIRKIASIQAGVSLTMTVDLTYTHTQAQGDEVVGTNGTEDEVEKYTSSYLTKSKYISTFENFLILGYTYENGVLYPQRERWNAIGDETSWKTGDAGSKETEGPEFITGFKIYSGQFLIFKKKSRIIQSLLATSEVWKWVVLPGAIGNLSNHSIVEDPDGRVYWLANDLTIREMGLGEISQDIDPIVKLIEPSSAHLVYGAYIEETGEIWWCIPYDNALNNKVITLKVVDGMVKEWGELNLAIPAFGDYYEA